VTAPTVTIPPPASGDKAQPPSHTLPAKDASSPYATATRPYVIGSLDVLDIKVWNAPNLSGFFEVGPDGMISMPLLGEIRGDGVTKEELTRTIREKLATTVFTEPPEVNVQVARVNSKKYYVFGPVFHGGEFPLLGPMTVLDAFALVGGFQDFANKKGIYIQRADPTAKNGITTLKFNYNDVSHGRHMDQNIQLQNGDRIFVP
jgi:polysaccharide export outer membrane protein